MHKKRAILFFLIITLLVPTIISAQEDKCKNVKYKALCYTLAAQEEKDKDICDNILNKEIRSECAKSASPISPLYFVIPGIIIIASIAIFLIQKIISEKNKGASKIGSFIKRQKAKGYSIEKIRHHLITHNVPIKLIREAFNRLKELKK
jgi:hypothetical protein|tara:strand:- start:86 stop:532 length:447 start_codon:yes stop_codon:yes gene_type:complete